MQGYRFNEAQGHLRVSAWSADIPQILRNHALQRITFETGDAEVVAKVARAKPSVHRVVLEKEVEDLSIIGGFTNAEGMNLKGGIETPDYAALRNLKELTLDGDAPTFGNLSSAPELRALTIVGCKLLDLEPLVALGRLEALTIFDAPLRSLSGLTKLAGLRHLTLNKLPLESLAGIDARKGLEELQLADLSKLKSVEQISQLKHLRRLMIVGVRGADDLNAIAECLLLETLELETPALPDASTFSRLRKIKELRINSSAKIDSLSFVRQMPELETLVLGKAPIADGDMSSLLDASKLRVVGYVERKQYRPSQKEILAEIQRRQRA